MEKKTNWSAVFNYLNDALDYFEGESSTSDAVHDMICALIDLVRSYM